MHPRVFDEFERLCREYGAGGDVIEIGAVASPDSLLCLPAIAHARSRIGVNLAGDARYRNWRIVGADATDLAGFADASFDTVLANAVLEHVPAFWRALAEMRRIARPGALLVVGVPGYAAGGPRSMVQRMARLPLLGRAVRRLAPAAMASTPTLVVHDFPGDYYRFSPQAVRDVFLDGLERREVRTILAPPRIVGAGTVPRRATAGASSR
jgi:SAM-dependent methyltransferase